MAALKKRDEPIGMVREELDLFGKDPYDVSVMSTTVSKFFPSTAPSDAAVPIIFNIPSTDTHYVDLSQTALYLRCKILKTNFSAVADTEVVAPVNQLLHSAFQQVNLYINDTKVTPPSTFYAQRAMIETILLFGKEVNKTQNIAAGYFNDTDNSIAMSTTGDSSYAKRARLALGSKEFELMGRPRLDLFHQHKYLPPSFDMRLEFIRNNDEFVIQCPKETGTHGDPPIPNEQKHYRLKISEAILYVTRRKILPSIEMMHITEWNKHQKMNYDLKKVDVKSFTIPKDTLMHVNETAVQGLLPSRLVLAFVATENLAGSESQLLNPFNYEHHNISNLTVTVNGDHSESHSLDLSFNDKRRYVEAYYNIFKSLGLNNSPSSIDMTLEEFAKGKALYVYEITPSSDINSLPRYGNVKIEIRFATAPSKPLTVLCYTETQAVLNIDEHRNIYYKDYSTSSV